MNKRSVYGIFHFLSICVMILGFVMTVFSLAVILMSGTENITAKSLLLPLICLVIGLAGLVCKIYYRKRM